MTKEEKLALYYKAKEAYYNGEEIMSDFEFDELEKELGLENKSNVGSTSPNYTIKHPTMMGSLSKIQVKYMDGSDCLIDWEPIYKDFWDGYMKKSKFKERTANLDFFTEDSWRGMNILFTPKYDGCSFEYYFDGKKSIVSTRGDGMYGKDIYDHVRKYIEPLHNLSERLLEPCIIRGEVLIDKQVFLEKYASQFTNPRSFVSGVLNRKYADIEDKSILDDLTLMIYDIRTKHHKDDCWMELDYRCFRNHVCDGLEITEPKEVCIRSIEDFVNIYNFFVGYRETCSYALDGFVAKPLYPFRNYDEPYRRRPIDCVAIKFTPMIRETKVTNIEWNLGKTGEYTPIVEFEAVDFDGKKVTKASGHNYGYIYDNKIQVGTTLKVSLAGDIIPFIYKVEEPDAELLSHFTIEQPSFSYIEGCHLMKELNEIEKFEIKFLASCKSLNIPGLGDKQAKALFDGLEYKVNHIYLVDEDRVYKILAHGEGKNAEKICNSIKESKQNRTLADVIVSMSFTDCGKVCAEECAKYLTGNSYDFTGLSSKGYEWLNDASKEHNLRAVLRYKDDTDKGNVYQKYKSMYETKTSKDTIYVILTGSPQNYSTKKEFLEAHPQYKETTKWNACQILFTGDLNSNSSKMQKARKLGIDIQEY